MDCADGSDEKNCTQTNCGGENGDHSQFRCKSGQCISSNWRCDLENDCQDGSDEENCTKPISACKLETEFQCGHDGQCIPKRWHCDGEPDCPGQEDEQDCDKQLCKDWQFTCANRNCIFKTWRCDGDKDCTDGSDEWQLAPGNCSQIENHQNATSVADLPLPPPIFPKHTCNEWMYKCGNEQCIPLWWKCDGTEDCSDGTDELECESNNDGEPSAPSEVPEARTEGTESVVGTHGSCYHTDKFQCLSGECIWKAWVCDGDKDCDGGEDESEAACQDHIKCTNGEFRCERSGQCIPFEKLCNTVVDCDDKSDELGCDEHFVNESGDYGSSCDAGEFVCDRGICHPSEHQCDGTKHCLDGKDEVGCNNYMRQQVCDVYGKWHYLSNCT